MLVFHIVSELLVMRALAPGIQSAIGAAPLHMGCLPGLIPGHTILARPGISLRMNIGKVIGSFRWLKIRPRRWFEGNNRQCQPRCVSTAQMERSCHFVGR